MTLDYKKIAEDVVSEAHQESKLCSLDKKLAHITEAVAIAIEQAEQRGAERLMKQLEEEIMPNQVCHKCKKPLCLECPRCNPNDGYWCHGCSAITESK